MVYCGAWGVIGHPPGHLYSPYTREPGFDDIRLCIAAKAALSGCKQGYLSKGACRLPLGFFLATLGTAASTLSWHTSRDEHIQPARLRFGHSFPLEKGDAVTYNRISLEFVCISYRRDYNSQVLPWLPTIPTPGHRRTIYLLESRTRSVSLFLYSGRTIRPDLV